MAYYLRRLPATKWLFYDCQGLMLCPLVTCNFNRIQVNERKKLYEAVLPELRRDDNWTTVLIWLAVFINKSITNTSTHGVMVDGGGWKTLFESLDCQRHLVMTITKLVRTAGPEHESWKIIKVKIDDSERLEIECDAIQKSWSVINNFGTIIPRLQCCVVNLMPSEMGVRFVHVSYGHWETNS